MMVMPISKCCDVGLYLYSIGHHLFNLHVAHMSPLISTSTCLRLKSGLDKGVKLLQIVISGHFIRTEFPGYILLTWEYRHAYYIITKELTHIIDMLRPLQRLINYDHSINTHVSLAEPELINRGYIMSFYS